MRHIILKGGVYVKQKTGGEMKRKINKVKKNGFKRIMFISALAVMAAATLWQVGNIVNKQKESQSVFSGCVDWGLSYQT